MSMRLVKFFTLAHDGETFKTQADMEHTGHLSQIVILLGAAVSIVALCRFVRLSPVHGYLVAGALIGPYGLKIIQNVETTSAIAEFGVVFLLFMIGLELSWDRLRAMRAQVFELGSAQVLLTAAIFAGAALAFGLKPAAAIILAGGLALSSTAVVLEQLAESGEKSSQVGRLSFAILLLQDLAVVPLLVLVPLLAESGKTLAMALGVAAVKAVIALALILVIGRLLLRPLFRIVASFHHAELFAATTLLVVLGTAWLTHAAGLSLALGAFAAGLLVAETEYQHQIEADIFPYKALLLGLFFMSVGMMVDIHLLRTKFMLILGLSLLVMFAKALIIFLLCRLFGFSRTAAIHSGLLLSQGGEFAFVLFGLAAQDRIISGELSQILLMVVTLTMAITPLAAALGKKIARRWEKKKAPLAVNLEQEMADLSDHVIIAGYGRMGQTVGRLLMEEGIPYIALDRNPAGVTQARAKGRPVYYGDAARADVLNIIGVKRARAAIVTIRGEEAAEKTLRALKAAMPELPVIVRAKDLNRAHRMEKAGADVTVPELFEGALQLGGAVLRELGVADHEISRIIEVFRSHNYELAREEGA